MYARALAVVLLATLGLGPSARADDEIKHIVVLPFTLAKGIDEKSGALLDEVHLSELTAVVPESIELIGSSDVTALLGLEEQRQLATCDETSCLIEIGSALGATHLLVPSLGEFGGQYIVTTKFLDVSAAKVLHRKVYYVDNSEQALLAGVRESVRELAQAQGWGSAESLGADSGVSDDALLYGGIGVAGVGALAAIGLGVGAAVFDERVGAAEASWDDRAGAAMTVVLMSVGSAAGVAAAVGGGAMIALAVSGE